jgi:hypothetical protein
VKTDQGALWDLSVEVGVFYRAGVEHGDVGGIGESTNLDRILKI